MEIFRYKVFLFSSNERFHSYIVYFTNTNTQNKQDIQIYGCFCLFFLTNVQIKTKMKSVDIRMMGNADELSDGISE